MPFTVTQNSLGGSVFYLEQVAFDAPSGGLCRDVSKADPGARGRAQVWNRRCGSLSSVMV